MASGEDLSSFISKLEHLWQLLENVGTQTPDAYKRFILIMALPDSYTDFKRG
jgi:hypothetical protein